MELTVRWSTGTLIVAVTTAVLAAGLGTPETPAKPAAGPPARDVAPTDVPPAGGPRRGTRTAWTALAALEVHPRAGGRGYARSRFGAVGYDADGNGCDTRDDALRRDVRGGVPSTDGCGVVGGSVSDPYTGARIPRTGAGTVVVAH